MAGGIDPEWGLRTTARARAVVLALLLSAAAGSGQAQDQHQFLHNTNPAAPLFECGQKTIGQVGCQAGVRCKCRYDAFGSAMTGMPPGYRWDCGLEQGTCTADIPATTSGQYGTPSSNQSPAVVVVPTPRPPGN
jgi:hypothetical protein